MNLNLKILCSHALLLTILSWTAAVARADYPRDWIFAAQPGGTYLNTDLILPGLQAQLEHRIPIYGATNELDLRLNVMPTLFFAESQLDVELRILILTLGASAGVRDTFFNMQLGKDERFDLDGRRAAEEDGRYTNKFSSYAEGRVQLSVPFNDYVALLAVGGARYEGGQDRVFDWRYTIVRDAGLMLRSNTTLFYHDRKIGGVGPQLEVLRFDYNGRSNTAINVGFTYVGRMGFFRRRYDLLYLTVLFGVGGSTNGVPTSEVYGDHFLRVPMNFQLAYRIVWELVGPKVPGAD
jgi:hypothetical protein